MIAPHPVVTAHFVDQIFSDQPFQHTVQSHPVQLQGLRQALFDFPVRDGLLLGKQYSQDSDSPRGYLSAAVLDQIFCAMMKLMGHIEINATMLHAL